jgi:hypothetical protein
VGTGTPKRRKKEGVFDGINEKGLPVPTQKTSWEIYLFLLNMPASAELWPPKFFLLTLHTTTSSSPHHPINSSHLHRASHLQYPLLFMSSSHYLSSLFLFGAHWHFIVISIMTMIMVWERKKEKKKIIRMKLEEDRAMVSVYNFNVLLWPTISNDHAYPPCHSYRL